MALNIKIKIFALLYTLDIIYILIAVGIKPNSPLHLSDTL